MANLPETPVFTPDIYQIETTDKVLGGPDGVVNLQSKQIADRTAWLKEQVEATALVAESGESKADSALAQVAAAETAMGSAAASAASALLYKNDALAAKALAEQARSDAQAAAVDAAAAATGAAADRVTAGQRAAEAQSSATAAVNAASFVQADRLAAQTARNEAVGAQSAVEAAAVAAEAAAVAAEAAAVAAEAARTGAEAAQAAVYGDLASSAAGKGAELVEYQGATVEAALNERLPEIGTYALLRAYTGPVTAFLVRGAANIFDGGAGVFRVDAADTTSADNGGTVLVDAGGRRWKRVYEGAVNVKWFGALGNNDQTLYATSYQADVINGGVTITQQTADAIAVNKAIVYLRSIGGGALYAPKGAYRIYGYLEPINFPIRIYGDGIDQTIFQNCDNSPTNANGYGIFEVEPSAVSAVTIEHLTLDGNATVRTQPTYEWRSYPLAFYGKVIGKVNCVKSINSPIDCFYTSYENANTSSMQVSNCTFDNSFRNTVSLVAGWNQSFVNCDITGGGKVQGGTNPRYCLDIEPNLSTQPIKNIKFTNCRFSDAENVLAGGTWCEAKFVNCEFDAIGSSTVGMPWAFNFGQSQITIANSKVSGDPAQLRSVAKSYNTYVAGGAYKDTQYLKILGCEFYGCGLHAIGRRTILENTVFLNSRVPVLAESSDAFRHELYVDNVKLINVVDVFNFGAGTTAAFAVKNTVEGPVVINGLTLEIDPAALPASPSFDVSMAYGIYLSVAGLSAAEFKMSNVHSSGYYRKLPTALGRALNAGNFRDWGTPNLPPADTAGQTAGPGVAYYRNCTAYGDAA